MRIGTNIGAVCALASVVIVSLVVEPAAGQASRRGYSSRGVNPVGSRGSVRSPVITGTPRPANNANFGANVPSPLNMNYLPNLGGLPNSGGYYLDLSSPYLNSGDLGLQGELGISGEGAAQGDMGSRPNIRPRLNIGDQDALNSITQLTSIRKDVMAQVAACGERPFTAQWYAAHADVKPVSVVGGNAWQRTQWASAGELVGIKSAPVRYDFRPDDVGLIFVYCDDVRQQRAVDVRGRAMELAKAADAMTDEKPAVPLGIFAAVPPLDEPVKSLLQIAISDSGTVSGYQYEFATDSMKPLRGAVDPGSQRVAWQVGSDFSETGLKNLTEDVTRSLLFKADGWTQSWILMRIGE